MEFPDPSGFYFTAVNNRERLRENRPGPHPRAPKASGVVPWVSDF